MSALYICRMKHKLYIIAWVLISIISVAPKAGAQWVVYTLGGESIAALAVNGDTLVAGLSGEFAGKGGVLVSTDNGVTWGDTGIVGIDVTSLIVSGQYILAGTIPQPLFQPHYNGGMYRSTDFGKSWTFANAGIPDSDIIAMGAIGAGTSSPVFFAGTQYDGIYRSTDFGASWSAANNGLHTIFVDGFAVAGANSSSPTIFAATLFGMYRSTDKGDSWEQVDNGLTDTNIYAVCMSGNNILTGSYFGGIFLSSDNGQSWAPSNSGPTNIDSQSIFGFTTSGPNVIATSNNTVYLSTNNGTSWESKDSTGLTITLPVIFGPDIYLATYDGVWRRALADYGLSAVASSVPVGNSLTAYPNPISESVKISFSPPESGIAEVTVVNLLGEEVARIFAGELSAGEHSFSWDASGMPPGMYECLVKMDGMVERVPMLQR